MACSFVVVYNAVVNSPVVLNEIVSRYLAVLPEAIVNSSVPVSGIFVVSPLALSGIADVSTGTFVVVIDSSVVLLNSKVKWSAV